MSDQETIADIIREKREMAAEIRAHLSNVPARREDQLLEADSLDREADRLEAARRRERESDKRLLFRLLWFDVDDYQSDWACNAYRQTVKDCCERLGIPYHQSGREIADEMDKKMLGKEVAKEVYDE